MENEILLPHLQLPCTSPFAEPDKSTLHHAVLFYEIHFNIILPCMHTPLSGFFHSVVYTKT
jgi:hypothetical protein